MSTYRAASGTDVALGSLTVLDPQPNEDHAGGIQYAHSDWAADGTPDHQGPYFVFVWDELSASQYSTILGVFGLGASTESNDVTVYVRDTDMATFVRKNGKALLPLPGDKARWNVRPKEIAIVVRNLTDAA